MKIIDEIIFISCRIKAEIVAKDESDKKSRMMLNFGHTLAHALEKLPENKLSHGQAVAIGMISFAMAGEKLKITEQNTADEIEKTLTAFGLPCETSFDRQNVVALIKRDKKIRDGKLNIILLKKIGKAVIYPILINDIGDFL